MENAFDPQINALGEALDSNFLEIVVRVRQENLVNECNRLEAAARVISGGPYYDLNEFVEALDQLQQSSNFFNSFPPSPESEGLLAQLKSIHDNATDIAGVQIYKMMTAHSNQLERTDLVDESESVFHVPTLISPENMPLVHDLIDRLVDRGQQTLCLSIYGLARQKALKDILDHLEEEDMQSVSIEDRIPKWIKLMRITVKSLFAGERNLCSQVLQGFENSLLEQCLLEITSSSLERLLNFGKDVASMKTSTANLYLLLDMYVMMGEVESEMEKMVAGNNQSTTLQPMMILRDWVAVTATDVFLGFSKEVENMRCMPTEDGGIHDLSIHVMKNLKDFISYQDILKHLLLQYKPGEDSLQFAPSCLQIMKVYQRKLEALAKRYTDPGQSYLFLMNNIHHMVISLKGIEGVPELLGEDWMSKQSRAAETNGELYRITCWGQVLERISGDLTAAVKKNAAKKRLKKVNKLLEEQLQKQLQWKVNDTELRQKLCTSVASIVVSAYRLFYEQFRPILQTSKSMKYTPEEVEKMLLERLFDRTETPG